MLIQKISKSIVQFTIFLIPFYFLRFSIFGVPTNVFELAVFAAFLATGFKLFVAKSKLCLGPIWPYLVLFIALIGIFLAPDKTTAAGIFKGWFLVPVVLWLTILNSFGQMEINKLAWPLSLSAGVISVWSILQKLGVISLSFYQKSDPSSFLPYLNQGRMFGPFESPNYLAMFLVPAIFFLFHIYRTSNRKFSRAAVIVLMLADLTAIYLSKSSGGYLALGLTLSWLGFKYFYSNSKLSLLARTSGSILTRALPVAAIFFAYDKLIHDNLRLDIYRYSWQMIKDNWVLGIGLGSFQNKISILSANNPSFQANGLPYALHPHNLFMALWLNLGVVGLILFLCLLFSFLSKIHRAKTQSLIYFALVIWAVLIQGLFDTTYFKNDLAAIFWLTYAIIYLSKVEQNAKARD